MSSEFQIDTFVGPVITTDGPGSGMLRQGRHGELIVSQAHAPYYEVTSRAQAFSATTALTGATVAAGHVAPPAAGAATLLSILNPLGSGVNLAILRGALAHVSGTPGAGAFGWCLAYQGDVVTATSNVVAQAMLTTSKRSVATCFSATALTGGVVHRTMTQFNSTQFAGAIAATTSGLSAIDDVNGMIVVAPGWMLTLAPPATGTTHVVSASIVWVEVVIAANS